MSRPVDLLITYRIMKLLVNIVKDEKITKMLEEL